MPIVGICRPPFFGQKNLMLISEAKTLVGQFVNVTYNDRHGEEVTELAEVWEVAFVPLYGPCVITDVGELRLDRIVNIEITDSPYLKAA